MVLTGEEFVEKKFFYEHEMSVILGFANFRNLERANCLVD